MILTAFHGFCMALADSVPGVSGGTIAFLMGFYDVIVGSLDALVHGTKQERLCGLRYLLKLAAGWAVGMALAVTVLAGAFTDGVYQLSALFLGFVLVSVPLVMREQRAVLGAFRENWLPFLGGLVLIGVVFHQNVFDRRQNVLHRQLFFILCILCHFSIPK